MGICALCYIYMKLIWCHGFAEIYAQLDGGFICFGCICIVIYMKHIWCNGFPEIYAQLEEGGWGQSVMGICALCYIQNFFGVMVFQRSILNWRRGGVNLAWVYVHCTIYICKFGVAVCKASMLGWGGQSVNRSMLHHYTSPAN